MTTFAQQGGRAGTGRLISVWLVPRMKTARCVCSLVVLRLTTLFTARGRGAVRPHRPPPQASASINHQHPGPQPHSAAPVCFGLLGEKKTSSCVFVVLRCTCVCMCVCTCEGKVVGVFSVPWRLIMCGFVWVSRKKGGKTHQDTNGVFFFPLHFYQRILGPCLWGHRSQPATLSRLRSDSCVAEKKKEFP